MEQKNKALKVMRPVPILILLVFLSSPATAISTPRAGDGMKIRHFVLVHRAFHGAWSWYKLSTILQSSGHKVTALDMAASSIDPRQAKTISSAFDYFQPLTEFLAGLPPGESVVLVGHSFGGLGVAVAMENFPEKISVAVFVAASMPGSNLSLSAIGIEDLTLAITLVRPLGVLSGEVFEFEFTEQRYGSGKRAFVATERDLMATRKFPVWMIENNPPDTTVEIKASDHMAMASKPLQLATQLLRIVHELSLIDF